MKYEKLSDNLGYHFHNLGLLERALRHRSMGRNSNERLEFLGDSVLNFIIAAELFQRYPDMKEGDLSRLRSSLVNGETLGELAKELNIGDFLQFGSGERQSGGAGRKSILADAMEAIIGAIYLDGGFEIAARHVLSWFTKRLREVVYTGGKDPKTLLQELLQARQIPLPCYKLVATSGASHEQIFIVECSVHGIAEATIGSGQSKRRAERNAAEKMLEKIENKKI